MGSRLTSACVVKFVPTCAVSVSTSAREATTLTVSVRAAGPISTDSGTDCAVASVTVRDCVPNPLN